ncbi:MAG: ATP synthase F1 subunit delta [Bacteroidota bacterium]
MVENRIGHRYAKSAFELAGEQGNLDQVHGDMGLFLEVYEQNRDFRDMLQSPIVNLDAKQKIIDRIFGRHFKSKLMTTLVALVVRKNREMYLPEVAQSFLSLYDEVKGIARGTIESAIPLSDQQVNAIQETLEKSTGKRFELTEEVNPELIGGFLLKVGDTQFDGSVASALRRAKQQLLKGAVNTNS